MAQTGTSALVDTRLLNKPQRLGKAESWPEWRFIFENFMTCVDAKYTKELLESAQHATPIAIRDDAAEDVKKRSATLYAVLASLLTGKDLAMCKALKDEKNGYELWRKIVLDHEPRSDSRKLALLGEILEARMLDNVKVNDFEQRLIEWEEIVREYVNMGGVDIGQDLKRALLMKKCPPDLRTHLQVNASTLLTYESMRECLDSYLKARNLWKGHRHGNAADPDAMDVGGIGEKCENCGKVGHARAQCWAPGGPLATKGGKGPKGDKNNKGGKGAKGDKGGKNKGKFDFKGGKASSSSGGSYYPPSGSVKGSPSSFGKGKGTGRQCYTCGSDQHLRKDCPKNRVASINDWQNWDPSWEYQQWATVAPSAYAPSAAPTSPQVGSQASVAGSVNDSQASTVRPDQPAVEPHTTYRPAQPQRAFVRAVLPSRDQIDRAFGSESWILGGVYDGPQKHLIAGAGDRTEHLLVDTGACRTVFRAEAFPSTQLRPSKERLDLRTIKDEKIEQYGSKQVTARLPGGRAVSLSGEVTDISTSAFSIGASNDQGMTSVFGPGGAYLTRLEPPRPADAEAYRREGNLFFLDVQEDFSMDRKQVIAPVALEENYEVSMDLREFQPEVEEYYRAVDAGEAVPFRLATRQVMNARQFRLPTNQEPCRWSQVFRRVTRDLATKEVLQDLRKDQQEADFNWTSFIPNGPKDIEI